VRLLKVVYLAVIKYACSLGRRGDMGLWRRLSASPVAARGVVVGDGAFAFQIAGASHYQDALALICGGRTREGVHGFRCAALLAPESKNPYDRNAIEVIIRGARVGYLHRDVALEFLLVLQRYRFRDAACEAEIVGGWDRGPVDRGFFGVRLNTCLPFRLCSGEQWWQRREA
jgi:hypothetical protein